MKPYRPHKQFYFYFKYFTNKIEGNSSQLNILQKMQSRHLTIYILLTSNNIFYTITDLEGNVIFWTSLGNLKINGTKKITLNAIKINLINLIQKLKSKPVKYHLIFKGVHKYKRFILKYIKQLSIHILSINDITKSAHNGCKKKKKRRL